MARLDAAIAAGYDPDAEFRSMLGRLMTDNELEDAAELDDDGSVPKVQEGQPESMTPDLDAEFNEQLSEEERRDEQGMMNPVRLLHVHVQQLMCYQFLLVRQTPNFHSKVSTSHSGMAPLCMQVTHVPLLLRLRKLCRCFLCSSLSGLHADKAAPYFLWHRHAVAWATAAS